MARTASIQKKIVKFLAEEKQEATFHEILRHINDTTRHGTTSQQLGNVLSKNPRKFERVGETFVSSLLSGGYEISVWRLSESPSGYGTIRKDN